MNALARAAKNYFGEFGKLKQAPKEFWITLWSVFIDSLSYFAMTTILSLYLTYAIGFDDLNAGVWVGLWMTFLTFGIFFSGMITDVIGIKNSFYIAGVMLSASLAYMGFAPMFLPPGPFLKWSVVVFMLMGAFPSAMLKPVQMTCLRRYTAESYRSAGFNFWYIVMNIGGVIAGPFITLFRSNFETPEEYLYIFIASVALYFFMLIAVFLMNEKNFQDLDEISEDEKTQDFEASLRSIRDLPPKNQLGILKKIQVGAVNALKGKIAFRPLCILFDVMSEKTFIKFLVFMLFTIGAKFGFANMFLVMPKYYTRVISENVNYELLNIVNPAIITVGLVLLVPIVKKFNLVGMIIVGSFISGISMLPMAIPPEMLKAIPGVNNITDAYWFVIWAQIFIFSFGEILWSPRLSEYGATIAPPHRVGTYMSLAALPQFIAKPVNAVITGYLLSIVCYDGIKAKIETGNIQYTESPEFMWLILTVIGLSTPILVFLFKGWLRRDSGDEGDQTPETADGEA